MAHIYIFNGRINPNFYPNYDLKVGLANNSIYINPSTKPYSELIVMVIDLKEMEVVYYDRNKSSNIDPRLPNQIKQMTMSLLRPIYYK
ncbi:MAG: hypothetical protein A2046_00235 [Bacteroidetes bacterium GWA2_30_7]|nr:MAG: hypothetical protein A2046_00235 [Bacteroidetes bacterium GWA2_30_7]